MSKDPSRLARIYRKLSPDEDVGAPRRAVPTGWVVGLIAVLILALPLGVFGSVLGADDGDPDPDLAAVRVSGAEADDDGADDDDRDRSDDDTPVRDTADGNTLRDGAHSITGNTRIGDTTERPTKDGNTARNGDNSITGNTAGDDTSAAPRAAAAPAPQAQGFAPAYAPAGGGSVSGGSASG